MTYALDALVIFLFIIVPGIAFRRVYFQGEFTKQYNSKTLSHSLVASILPGMVIQLITIIFYQSLISKINGEEVELFYDKLTKNTIPINVFDKGFLISILTYVFFMLIISWLFAQTSYKLVRLTKVDRKNPLFRFKNHWNYYFNGELNGFSEFRNLLHRKNVLEVRADVLIDIENEEPRLYSGVLSQHTINNVTYELENIYLTNVGIYKKEIGENKRIKKNIPGDVMIINAKHIININLKYITIQKTRKDFSGLINVTILIIVIFILFSNYHYFNSNTLLKTILIKLFFSFYTLVVFTFINKLLMPSSAKKKEIITGFLILIPLISILYWVFRFLIF